MHIFNPTGFLFPLVQLSASSTTAVEDVMERLALIYSEGDDAQLISGRHGQGTVDGSLARLDTSLRASRSKAKAKQDDVVDSGYASAEEDGEDEEDDGSRQSFASVRNDSFEREFTIRWLTGFIARSSIWMWPTHKTLSDEELEEREALVDKAASLLSSCANACKNDDEALSRHFTFSLGSTNDSRAITIELNDLLAPEDHDSVGLQSWASSIYFARMMSEDPARFGILPDKSRRFLELGAGTGMLSIATAKIIHELSKDNSPALTEIVATDYHPDVLVNLKRNVEDNVSPIGRSSVTICSFDWQFPSLESPFDATFDVILAADVVYEPRHAGWIKNCISRLLKKPTPSRPEGGVFWMIIALRNTGRHEGLAAAVFEVFHILEMQSEEPGGKLSLKAVQVQDLERCEGLGRRDEAGYRLFKICWV